MTARIELGVQGPAWEDVLLRDGTIARVRDAVAGDRDRLIRLHDACSEGDRREPFFHVGHHDGVHFVDSLLPRLTSDEAFGKLATVDGDVVGLATAMKTGRD